MNIEAYSYTVLSAILGILIVFAFLGFLCLFMIVLKRIVDGNPVKVDSVVTSGAAVSDASASASDDTDWITAAVAAYLEEEDSPRSAMSWLPAENEKLDPWVSTPRVQKTFAGA